jgi:hypothetical protein
VGDCRLGNCNGCRHRPLRKWVEKQSGCAAATSVIDPNASRIAEYRSRLDEETRKLAAEQATLNQAKQAAATADPRIAAAMPTAAPPSPPPDDRLAAKRQLEAERERKEYSSLFASNLALTFRKESADSQNVANPMPPLPGAAAAATYPYQFPVPPTAPVTNLGAPQGGAPAADPADGAELKREKYTAHFVFVVKDRVPNAMIPVNPLGLTITYFREDQAF